MQKVKKLLLLICTILIPLCALSACSPKGELENANDLCDRFVMYAIANYKSSAYGMVKDIPQKEFDAFWKKITPAFENTTAYEIKQMNWEEVESGGKKYIQLIFEITTDDNKTCYLQLTSTEEMMHIYSVIFLDSTEFINSTTYIPTVNMILLIVSLLLFAFEIWMFVDCAKNCHINKVLWMILIFLGATLGIITGEGGTFGLYFTINLFFNLSSVIVNSVILGFNINIALPLGAIAYLCFRKKLIVPDNYDYSSQNTQYEVLDNAELENKTEDLPQNPDQNE